MRIAFVFIAEAYQCYHLAAVALELQKREGVSVDIFYNDPETPRHLDRIAAAFDSGPVGATELRRDWRAKLIRLPRIFGLAKKSVLRANRDILLSYDMVVSPERIGSELTFNRRPGDARVAYICHGPAGRSVANERLVSRFDLILLAGNQDIRRYSELGCLNEGGYRVTGYPKLETVEKLNRAAAPLFANDRPIILYNPHKIRSQTSWHHCIEPMLRAFEAQDRFNLIVAPHVKLFYRRSRALRKHWADRSTANILIDPGSDRSLDGSYTAMADIYVGDVSSQVSEFLMRPRPCIFLNPHHFRWRDVADFGFWNMGEVVDDVADLMPAIERAHAMHPTFLPAQKEFFAETVRQDITSPISYTADTIMEFLRNGRVDP